VPRKAVKVVIITDGSRTVTSPHGDSKNSCESLGGHGF
jgi:virulence-associated protein VagC